jgi:hypothetical protein
MYTGVMPVFDFAGHYLWIVFGHAWVLVVAVFVFVGQFENVFGFKLTIPRWIRLGAIIGVVFFAQAKVYWELVENLPVVLRTAPPPAPTIIHTLGSKQPRPGPTSQQQSGKNNVQTGPITSGPCSNLQIGGSNNQGTIDNCQATIISAPPDRTLSDSQERAISEIAKDISPEVKVVVEHPSDYESSEYAKTIHDALAEFHLAELTTALSYGGQPPPVGLYVLAHTDDDKVIPYANKLYDAMKKAGIPCEGYQVDWVPSGTLRISVGIKPPSQP